MEKVREAITKNFKLISEERIEGDLDRRFHQRELKHEIVGILLIAWESSLSKPGLL